MATRAPDYTLEGESGDRERYLVLAHQGGDPFAFTEIVKDHYRSMYTHARRRTGDPQAAEDAVQDALLRAYKGLDGFGGDYNLAGWLHRIVDNVCTDHAARRARDARLAARFGIYADPNAPAADEDVVDLHAEATVRSAVASLSDTYREALVLRDVMDMEYADVAEHIGITEENARARVSRARAALKKLIGPVAVVLALLGRVAKRGGGNLTRISAKLTSQLNSAAGQATATATQAAATVPPDVVAAPTRLAPAIGTVAAAAVAAVASVGIPTLVSHSGTPAAAPAPQAAQQFNVSSGPATPVASSVVTTTAPTATTAAPPTSSSTTAAPVVSPPVTASSPAPPAPSVVAILSASGVYTGGGTTSTQADLRIGESAPVAGTLSTTIVTSVGQCSWGSLGGKFAWDAGDGGVHRVTIAAPFTSFTSTAGSTVYSLRGTAVVLGGSGLFDGLISVKGTVTVPSDGSDGTVALSFVSPAEGGPNSCPNGPPPTTAPATTAPPTTTAAPTTTLPATTTTAVADTALVPAG